MQFFELEPFGYERADLRSGIVASTMANIYRDRKKQKKAFKPKDFMPKFGREHKRQPWQYQKQLVELLNVAFGGRDLREGKDDHDRNAGDKDHS